MNDKIIGIIGGMGPEATAYFYMKIIKATKAKKDQEHFRVIIDSNAKIPDRTAAIFGTGQSPVEAIVQTGKNLELLGADIGCIPCITSHFFINDVQKHLSYPILNALEEVNKYIISNYPQIKKVGVLATSGTVKTGLFDKYLTDIDVIYPSPSTQNEKVMDAIYGDKGIKSGNTQGQPIELLQYAASELVENGAQLLIAGCTEIGLVLRPSDVDVPLLDPLDVMAIAVTR